MYVRIDGIISKVDTAKALVVDLEGQAMAAISFSCGIRSSAHLSWETNRNSTLADEATRSGRYAVSDATDFYKLGKISNMENVVFRFIAQDKCAAKTNAIANRQIKTVNGTMKVHAIVGNGNSVI